MERPYIIHQVGTVYEQFGNLFANTKLVISSRRIGSSSKSLYNFKDVGDFNRGSEEFLTYQPSLANQEDEKNKDLSVGIYLVRDSKSGILKVLFGRNDEHEIVKLLGHTRHLDGRIFSDEVYSEKDYAKLGALNSKKPRFCINKNRRFLRITEDNLKVLNGYN